MDERRYRLPDQETYSISGHALGKLLRRADPNAALTYLYILREGGNLSISCATEALRLAEQEVYDALAVLAKLGLLSGSDTRSPDDPPVGAPPVAPAPPDYEELPQYTAAEIQREMTTDTAFSALVKEVGGALGKILTGDDLRILMGLYRSLGLPPEVIYQLVCHLTKESDSGRRSTMRGIEKMAYIWARNGITTLDAALEHIERRQQMQSAAGQLKRDLDLPVDKKLTPTQEKYLLTWLDQGFDRTVIQHAYDITVTQTGGLKWPYLNAILNKWQEKGLITVEAIQAAEGGGPKPKKQQIQKAAPVAPDRQEIARKRRLLDQMDGKS